MGPLGPCKVLHGPLVASLEGPYCKRILRAYKGVQGPISRSLLLGPYCFEDIKEKTVKEETPNKKQD